MQIAAFTSDPHYGHKNIIRYCNRPFSSIDEMTRELIARYNSKVSQTDTVLWGGDCFFCPFSDARQILQELNGSKVLILGNHDRGAGSMAVIGFSIVMEECVLNIAGQTVRVKHYPYDDKRYQSRCPIRDKHEMLIHGHTHSPNKLDGKQIHIGVDAWNYTPALMSEIEEIVTQNRTNHLDDPNKG